MNGPVVALDVSKGKSVATAFLPGLEQLGKAVTITHSQGGFETLMRLHSSLREKSGEEPSIVYESTGVYSHPVREFLVSGGYVAYEISPLLSAKARMTEIRATKTDSIDPRSIAKAFYLARGLRRVSQTDPLYRDLAEMNSYYNHLVERRKADINRYKRAVSSAWAGIEGYVNPSSMAFIAVVAKYGHPSNIRGKNGILAAIRGKGMGKMPRDRFVDLVLGYAQSCSTGCRKDSAMAFEASEMAKRLAASTESLKKARSMLISMAKKAPSFAVVRSAPGVGDTLAAMLVACIGDVTRFKSGSALVAYAGLDPTVSSSGTKTGEHLSITRKGNKFLRHALYLTVIAMRKLSPESKISKFADRKYKNGLCKKAAFVAGSSKLARILYAMMTNLTPYRESL